jgi:hypothetical protein
MNSYKLLVEISERKKSFRRHRLVRKDITKTDFKGLECEVN